MEEDKNKKSIYQEREKYRQRAFFMMLEVAVIIALPAFAALFLGGYLDKNNQSHNVYKIILLVIAFILSWTVIIIKYIKLDKKAKEIDKKIREMKEK